MSALTILTSEIRQFDGLYSLNDLHKASGGADKHRPTFFMRLDTTQALMAEIRCADVHIIPSRIVTGRGKAQGTYVCKELVYAYAMWISPSFHLKVIRAFDALQTAAHPGQLSLPLQRYLVSYDENGTQRVTPVPADACVMSSREFIKALGDPNGFFFDNQMLIDLLDVVARRIPMRLKYQEGQIKESY